MKPSFIRMARPRDVQEGGGINVVHNIYEFELRPFRIICALCIIENLTNNIKQPLWINKNLTCAKPSYLPV